MQAIDDCNLELCVTLLWRHLANTTEMKSFQHCMTQDYGFHYYGFHYYGFHYNGFHYYGFHYYGFHYYGFHYYGFHYSISLHLLLDYIHK